VPSSRFASDALRAATADRARDAASMLARCRSTARGSEAVLALTEARARLHDATSAHAASGRALGIPAAEAVGALREALGVAQAATPADYGLVCDEVLTRFAAALAAP
jgi:hypothetical protein